jgi:hypothetical protein
MNEKKKSIFQDIYFPGNIYRKILIILHFMLNQYSYITIENDHSYIYLNSNKFPY